MAKHGLCLMLGVIFFACVCGLAGAATTGKITGRVLDQAGAPLPGANVVIEGTNRGATTDADGYYLILSVEPGAYTLKASMIGYTGETKTDVRAISDITTTVDFKLAETRLELGEMVVVAERPPVEPDVTESRYVVSADEIEVLPTLRSMENFVELEAGVNVDGSLRVRNVYNASGAGEAEYVVDGIRLTYADGRRSGGRGFTQNWRGNVNTSAISEITVLAGGLNAEYGNIGSIQIVTRDGGRDFHGQMHYRFAPAQKMHWGKNAYVSVVHRGHLKYGDPAWENETDATGRLVHQRPSKDYTDVAGHFLEASLSGPITKGFTFFVSTKHDFARRDLPRPDQRQPFNADVTYKLTAGITPELKVRVGGLFSTRYGRYADGFDTRAIFLPDRGADGGKWRSADNVFYIVATHSLSAKTFYEVRLSRYSSVQDTSDIPAETVDPELDADGYYYITPGASRQYQVGKQTRLAMRFDLSSQVNRSNFIKAGFTLTRYNAWKVESTETTQHRNRTLYYFGKMGQLGKGMTPWEMHAYIQDKMEYEGLIVNAGLRYERFWGEKVPIFPYQGAPMTNSYTRFMKYARWGDMQSEQWFLPRLGISHPISSRSKIHFFYGKFHTRPDFDMYFRNRWRVSGKPSLDKNGDGVIGPEEENNNLFRNDGFGSAFAIDNPSFQYAQVATEFELGTEWNFISDYVLQATAYYHIMNGFLSVQSMVFRDPTLGAKAKTRAYGPRRQTTTRGIEWSLKKGLTHNFSFKAAVTMGWGDLLTIGGTKKGNGETSFYPDASFIADPSRYWQEWEIDPNTGEEIPKLPTGAKLEELKTKAQAQVDLGLAGELATGALYRSEFKKLWEEPGLSAEERQALRGLYSLQTTGWSVEANRGDIRSMQGSLVLVYASPPDFGPGREFWGSRVFGDLRVNLIYRLYTGNKFDYTDPVTSLTVKKEGPAVSTVDLSIQKGFNIRGVRPLLYVEVNNLFNFKGTNWTSPDYIRWGLLGPQPNDPQYLQYGGDVDELTRFNRTDPRQVFAGVRLSW